MAKVPYMLIPGSASWRLCAPDTPAREIALEADAAPAAVARSVAAALREVGYAGQGVMIGLPSGWCLAAGIWVASIPPRDRAAAIFRLEEQLPLAAEQFTADWVRWGDHALGIAVANERIAPVVIALESAGVMVQSISPVAMLAAQRLGAQGGAAGAPGSACTILWPDDDQFSAITLRDGSPVAWSLADADQLPLALKLLDLEAGGLGPVMACNVDDATIDRIAPQCRSIERKTNPPLDHANAQAADVLDGRASPWFEFRRDAMVAADSLRSLRRPLNVLLASAAMLLIALALAMVYRGWRYDQIALKDEGRMTEQFKQAFPGWPVPVNVRAIVESERRKLAAQSSTAMPPEARKSAMNLMRAVLTGLPPGAGVAIERVRFDGSALELEGRARAYEDVDPLVSAARASGLEVPPPQMRKTSDGMWSFVIHGAAPEPAGGK